MTKTTHRVAGLLLFLGLLTPLLAALLVSCDTSAGRPPYPVGPAAEQLITNAVATAVTVVHTVAPAPFAGLFELIGAAVLAILACWQAITHRKVTLILNGGVPPPKDS